jgi:hypothetical protein
MFSVVSESLLRNVRDALQLALGGGEITQSLLTCDRRAQQIKKIHHRP